MKRLVVLIGLAMPLIALAQESVVKLTYQEYSWKKGEPAVKMIRKDEGFCYLSKVQGRFDGAGETVRVYIGDDGFWYLDGPAVQNVTASAIAVKFSAKVEAAMIRAPSARELADLNSLRESKNEKVRAMAQAELGQPLVDARKQLDAAKAWLEAAAAEESELRQIMEGRGIELLESAARSEDKALSAEARQRSRAAMIALANRTLGDLGQWVIDAGAWQATTEGRISGSGNSMLTFRHPLPADCDIAFNVRIVEGMRLRIHLDGTSLYFGNEGFERVIEAHGAQSVRGVKFAYKYEEDLAVEIKRRGANFELRINGEPMAKGTGKKSPETVRLKLSSGDDWSKGVAQFWGFAIKPAEDK